MSIMLAAVLLLLAGCRKDNFDEDKLIGTWEAYIEGYTYTYVFLEDHSGYRSYADYDRQNLQWNMYGDELEIRVSGTSAGVAAYETFIIESLTDRRMEAYDKNDPSEKKITFNKK